MTKNHCEFCATFVTSLNRCIFSFQSQETMNITKRLQCTCIMFGTHKNLRNSCNQSSIPQRSVAHGAGNTLLEAEK